MVSLGVGIHVRVRHSHDRRNKVVRKDENMMYEDRDMIRGQVLGLMHEADLSVEATLEDLHLSIPLDDWASVNELIVAGGFTEQQTILELLASIQSFPEES